MRTESRAPVALHSSVTTWSNPLRLDHGRAVALHGLGALLLLLFVVTAWAQTGMQNLNANGEFIVAARSSHLEDAKRLLLAGAAVNSRDGNGDTALNIAARRGDGALFELVMGAQPDVNLGNIAGVTPLMSAAYSGHAELLEALLKSGADIDATDRIHKTAAIYAAGTGHTECVIALLAKGIPVDRRYDHDETLLMWAAGFGNTETVKTLLAKGADPTLKDDRGMTPAQIAEKEGHADVAALLR
ncbi:MAG: ankyrin repeat domain-containing protein [Burkholderiaceae bacterium]|jgi:ankyrin repeat protein